MSKGKLTDRWRPDGFDKVVGQPAVVAWCLDQLAQNDPQSAIFFGPSGCGKNTLARLYGQALACTAPTPGGLACGKCDACHQPMGSSKNGFYAEVPCAEIRTKRALAEHLESLTHASWVGRRRVVVFDEVQCLSSKLQVVLLRLLEKPPKDSVILILTTDFEALIPALQSRVSSQEFLRIAEQDLVEYGMRVCISESISFDQIGLDLISRYSKGQARDFLQMIDDVRASSIKVTEDAVRRHRLGGAYAAIRVLDSLLNGDLKQARSGLSLLHRAKPNTDELFRDVLVAVEYRTRQIESSDDELCTVPAAAVSALLEVASRAADREGVDRPRIWGEIRQIWQKSPARSLSGLSAKLLDIHRWLHERQPFRKKKAMPLSRALFDPGRTATSRRPHRHPEGSSPGENSLEQAKRVWDSASLMSQVYGVYFNSRIVIRPARLGFKDDEDAQKFVGKLIKGLAGRIQDWRGPDIVLHWVYTKTGAGECATYLIALAIPDDLLEFLHDWLVDKFLARQFADLRQGAVSFRWAVIPTSAAQSRYQAHLLRMLCRGIDTKLVVHAFGAKRLLADVIGVSRRLGSGSNSTSAGLNAAYVSKSIGRSEARKWKQSALPVLTPAKDGAWDYANPGWELEEYRDRCAELERRAAQDNLVPNFRAMADDSRARELLAGFVDQSADAKDRIRSWPTPELPAWWQSV